MSDMFCRNCGHKLNENDLFCGKCGVEINVEIPLNHICNNCGNILNEDEIFCSKCGTKVPVEIPDKKSEIKQQLKNKWFVFVIAGIIVILVILLIVVNGTKNRTTAEVSQPSQIITEAFEESTSLTTKQHTSITKESTTKTSSTSKNNEIKDANYSAVVNADPYLNLREKPDALSKKVAKVDNGASVTVIAETDEWAKISFDGKMGWVSKKYIKKTADKPANYTATANADPLLFVREKPDVSAKIIDKIPKGTVVSIVAENGVFAKTKYNGKYGWVNKNNIKTTESNTTKAVTKSTIKTITKSTTKTTAKATTKVTTKSSSNTITVKNKKGEKYTFIFEKKTPFTIKYYDNEFNVTSVSAEINGEDFDYYASINIDGNFVEGNSVFSYVYLCDQNGYVVDEADVSFKGKSGGPAKNSATFWYLNPGTYTVEFVAS